MSKLTLEEYYTGIKADVYAKANEYSVRVQELEEQLKEGIEVDRERFYIQGRLDEISMFIEGIEYMLSLDGEVLDCDFEDMPMVKGDN